LIFRALEADSAFLFIFLSGAAFTSGFFGKRFEVDFKTGFLVYLNRFTEAGF